MVRLVLLLAVAVAGCASSGVAPTTPFEKEVTIAQGKTVSVVEGVSVHFIGVTGDSRCPADVVCIQGGDATVKLQVTSSGDAREVELHTGSMEPGTAGDLTIALLKLEPYPFSTRTVQPDDYRATIRVKR